MLFTTPINLFYRHLLKNILFKLNPELVHNAFTHVGESLESQDWLVGNLFRYNNSLLKKEVLGITFDNPIGLAAGFDYDGHMAQVMHSVGFGFNTVGTVTALSYEGNSSPRLARLPRSKSLLVNKGFKSEGARKVRTRLDKKNLDEHTVGISVGSSNLKEVNSIKLAITDYLKTFELFQNRAYVKYFELNISCPNITLKGAFTDSSNFTKLCRAVNAINISQPIFVKMPNEINHKDSEELIRIALKHNIRGFIFSNLVKDRTNSAFDSKEIASVSHLAGNFSGRPTFDNSNSLITHARTTFGNKIAIIGCGGVFSASDAQAKLAAGADLVQLITGMIFEGPQLIGQINHQLASIEH